MPTRKAALADVYSHLKAVMMAFGKQWEAKVAKDGMSVAQMILLYRLSEEGPRTPKALSKALGVTPGNITRLVEKLEAIGYATRTRSKEDLRVVHVQATREGEAAIQGGFDAQAKVLTQAFGDWSDDEVQQLRGMLARLVPEEPAAAKPKSHGTAPKEHSPQVTVEAPASVAHKRPRPQIRRVQRGA